MTKRLLQNYRILFEEFGPQHWWPGETRDEVILGAVLTQNTSWTNAEKAITNLRKNGLLSLQALADAPLAKVIDCVRPSGHHNQKAERLVGISLALTQTELPTDSQSCRNFLLSLKGIGPETADSILLYAYGFPVFVVDAYTRRIFHRLGLCSDNASYEDLQNLIMQHLKPDTDLYNEYHALLVRLAKNTCRKNPLCAACPLQELCQYAQALQAVEECR